MSDTLRKSQLPTLEQFFPSPDTFVESPFVTDDDGYEESFFQDELICKCLQICRRDIEAAKGRGCLSLEEVRYETGASSVCGSCSVDVLKVLGIDVWQAIELIDRKEVTEDVCSFRFRSKSTLFEVAMPGQFVVLRGRVNNEWVERCYTLTSLPQETDFREITVKRVPGGLFSNWLFDEMDSGSLLFMSKPMGDNVVEPEAESPVVCLVAGIGMTPALSFYRSFRDASASRELFIDYSASSEQHSAWQDDIHQDSDEHSNIGMHFRETCDEGRITEDDLESLAERFPEAEFFICGPDGYNTFTEDALRRCGVLPEQIRVETFSSDSILDAVSFDSLDAVVEEAKSVSINHTSYKYVGLILLAAFVLQDLFQWKWIWLEHMQEGETYKRWSGLFLLSMIGLQWSFPLTRNIKNHKHSARFYNWHLWMGAFSPLFLFVHSTHFGYALLVVLSSTFLLNALVGLLNRHSLQIPSVHQKSFTLVWTTLHVMFSFLLMGLIAYHVLIVFLYN